MSTKDLFNKNKLLAKTSMDALTSSVESAGYVTEFIADRDRIIPQVDFSDPSQFCKFGSAKKYFLDSISYIYNYFPFDGSGKEKLEFYNSSSAVDLYILNQYPKFTGYVNFSPNGWSTQITQSNGFGNPLTKEYILIHGGPNTGSLGGYVGANVYDTGSLRVSNLRFGGDYGNTVEFWLKKGAPVLASSTKEVIFDIWNNVSASHAAGSNYGRLLIYVDGAATLGTSCFKVSYVSGSVNACTDYTLGTVALTASSVLNDTWNHYAFSFKNSGADLAAKVYFNGTLDSSVTIANGAIDEVRGTLWGSVGSLLSSSGVNQSPPQDIGWGKLSGSIDEFRFWKKERTLGDIGRYWFTHVNGGANSSDGNTSLGVYYKFNEGITSASSDSTVLDYSGRLSHGAFIGYTSAHRSTDSAINTYFVSSSTTESADPTIYSFHPDVVSLESEKSLTGSLYDQGNNTSLYYSMPSWMIEEDEEKEKYNLLNLTQIMGQYFDNFYLQVGASVGLKDISYSGFSGSNKPYPFVNKMLQSKGFDTSELFSNVSALESLANRSDKQEFELKLSDVKNSIYQNIYNNLSYIYKTKGTLNSVRNLIRCFGVDEELVRLNIYANNSTYLFNDNFRTSAVKKKYVDFNGPDRFYGTVYQYSSSNNVESYSYLTSSGTNAESSGSALTAEFNVMFPKKFEQSSEFYFETPFISSSLFGMHTVEKNSASVYDTSWDATDSSNFQAYAVREKIDSKHVYFVLTSSTGGPLPRLTSDLITDVYDNNQWTVAVKVRPEKYPYYDVVSGSEDNNFVVEFCGYNTVLDTVVNSFSVSSSLTYAQGANFLNNSKRFYVGAHKNNFTGSNLQATDVKAGSFRVWLDYLTDDEILHHAYDISRYGVDNPYKNITLNKSSFDGKEIPKAETLALNWDFELVTGSDGSGQFQVADITSGSSDNLNRYGWLSNATEKQLEGRGDGFLSNDLKVVDVDFISRTKSNLPETIGDDDFIQILERDDETFTRDTRPTQFFYSVEKSMYQTISEEMVNMFSSILDFNNLVGQPVNRYRAEYKDLSKMRQLFFERIGNTPDVEKYIEYYKWIDSSLVTMIKQLVPASVALYENMGDVIESHILERNKYQTKFPTMEFKQSDPTAGIEGINKLRYDWKIGTKPLSGLQSDNALYWKQKAIRTETPLSSSIASVNESRTTIFNVLKSTIDREGTTPQKLIVEKDKNIGGGSNSDNQLASSFLKHLVNDRGTYARVVTSSLVDVNDYNDLGKKKKISSQVYDSKTQDYKKGNVLPFSIFSSSVRSGYNANYNQGATITNLHNDSYIGGEVPMQGPFTEKYVGGNQYRHNVVNSGAIDDQTTRMEGFKLYPNAAGYMDIYNANTTASNGYSDSIRKGIYLRDEGAKRPINVRNIRGANFDKNYQVVQTSGRRTNNKAFVMSGGFGQLISASSTVSGLYDYQIPDRGRTESIFVEKFSAPGGVETSNAAGLDSESGEYSIYNSYNYRNLRVRGALYTLLTRHCGQFGTDSLYGNVNSTYESSASFHKNNRNTYYKLTASGDTYVTASKYDNFFISHATPASDRGYSWITSSAITIPFGYALNSDDIVFVSSSFSSSIDGVYGVGNFVGVMSSSLTASNGLDFNLIMNNRGAAGRGYPMWKQIRTGERNDARYKKNNNIIEILDPSPIITTVKDGKRFTVQARLGSTISSYKETPVTNKFKPLISNLTIDNDGIKSPISLQVAFGNQTHTFSPELANKLGVQSTVPAMYNRLTALYSDTTQMGGNNQIESMDSLTYSETVYPSDTNSYAKEVRGRENYSVDYWSHARDHRNTVATNSQGYVVSQSIWALDARNNFTSSMPQTGSVGSEGELQNLYSTFFCTSSEDPTLLGNYISSVVKFGAPWEINGTAYGVNTLHGCNDRINLGGSASFDQYLGYDGFNDYTVSAWVQPILSDLVYGVAQPDKGYILSFGTGSAAFYAKIGTDATHRRVGFTTRWGDNSGGASPEKEWISDDELTNNAWHHIAMVYDKKYLPSTLASAVKFYIDGVESTVTAPAPDATLTTQQRLEGMAGVVGNSWHASGSMTSPYEGYLSNIAVFSGSFSAAEISELYNSGKPKSLYLHSRRNDMFMWLPLGNGNGLVTGSAGCSALGASFNTWASCSIGNDNFTSGSQAYANGNIMFDVAGANNGYSDDTLAGNVISYYSSAGVTYFNILAQPRIVENSSLTTPLYGVSQFRDPSWSSRFAIGAQYTRPEYSYLSASWPRITLSASSGFNQFYRQIHMTGSKIVSGDTEWVGNVGARDPMFDSYSEWAQDVRKYSDYSTIPSFNISEHMDYYLNTKKGNFLADNDGMLTLDGGTYSSSLENNFYKTYSHGDLMEYFDILKQDHEGIGDIKKISLKAKGVVKMLPGTDFYPANYSLKLAEIFSQSFGDYVSSYGADNSSMTASWRAFFNPVFNGLVYNSIKSGLAVDYPIYNSPPKTLEDVASGIGGWDYRVGGAQDSTFAILTPSISISTRTIYGSAYNAGTSSYQAFSNGNPTCQALPASLDSSSYTVLLPLENDDRAQFSTVLASPFSARLPFESLFELESSPMAKNKVYDAEPEYSASLRSDLLDYTTTPACAWGGQQKLGFKLAIHNYAAALPYFYLKEQKMASFVSDPIPASGVVVKEADKDSIFGMDVVVHNSQCKNLTDWNARSNLPQYSTIADNFYTGLTKDDLDTIKGKNFTLFSRDSAFGPNWVYPSPAFTGSDSVYGFHHSLEPFTNPAQNGFGLARMLWKPPGPGSYTLDYIHSHLTMSYVRMPSDRVGVGGIWKVSNLLETTTLLAMDKNTLNPVSASGVISPYDVFSQIHSASQNWMALSASINLLGKTKIKNATFEKGTVDEYRISQVASDSPNESYLWNIQPKWELVADNYQNVSANLPQYGSGSISKGQWLQKGIEPQGSEGLWFSINDIPDVPIITKDCTESSIGGSCIWLGRSEATVNTGNTNAEATIYIADYTVLSATDLYIDGTFLGEATSLQSGWASGLYGYSGWVAATSNMDTAQGICNCINSIDSYGGPGGILNADYSTNRFSDDRSEVTQVIPLRMRFTASAYLPDVTSLDASNPIAAVRVRVIDVATSTTSYPNYYASGKLGNDLKIYSNFPSQGGGIEGKDPGSDKIIVAPTAYFYGGITPEYKVKSLADLVGFKKQAVRLGQVDEQRIISECVVAVPFIEKYGYKEFIKIPRRKIDIALGKISPVEGEIVGKSIVKQVELMKRFVMPPRMNFLDYDTIEPFVIYMFEFTAKMTKQDLLDCWNNTMPEISVRMDHQEVIVEHELDVSEALGNLKENLRWMLFKVKQKAPMSYYDMTADSNDDQRFAFEFKAGRKEKPIYSYNYPYDQMSLVELVKLDEEITIEGRKKKV